MTTRQPLTTQLPLGTRQPLSTLKGWRTPRSPRRHGYRRSRHAGAVTGAALLGLVLAGCSRPVAMTDPAPDPAVRTHCAAVMAALPDTVLDQHRRTVQPGELSAAWGSPTITLRCGVPKPPGLGDASECFEVNGVGWFAEEAQGGYLFTTIGRAGYVEVGVPDRYAPEANALVDLATAAQELPLLRPCV